MKKAGLTITTILFSLFIILPSLSFADKDGHGKSSNHEPMGNERYEEGSGSSALESSSEAKDYESSHEAKEEGSFSYSRHRKEMKQKKAMEEGMAKPAATSGGKMEEGSGKR